MRNLYPEKNRKVSYTATITRRDVLHLPQKRSGFKLGQRVVFAVREGEIVMNSTPVRVVSGRPLSSYVRTGFRTLICPSIPDPTYLVSAT